MTDDGARQSRSPHQQSPRSRATRRGFLALAGATTLAGCNGFGLDRSGDDGPTLDGAELRAAVASEPPSVPETVPVEISRSDLDGGVARARELLESAPAPFDADEIPNGAIRAELTREYEDSEEAIASVDEAASPLEATERLHEARGSARTVADGWRAIEEDLTCEAVRSSAEEVWDALDRFRYRWDYLGTDPVAALVVHATVEDRVRRATDSVERVVRSGADPDRDGPVAVGELAGRLEVARAALDDAAALYRPLRRSGDGRTFRSGFVRAVDALGAAVHARRRRLPDADPQTPSSYVDGDVEGTPIGSAIGDLADELSYRDDFERERRTDEYASAAVAGLGTLARLRALESLRQRAGDGYVTVESVDDVRTLRERAIDAIESVREAEARSHLNRRELAAVDGFVAHADRELRGYDGDDSVSVDSLTRDLGNYVAAAAIARAVPEASAEVATIVRRSV